MRKKKMTRCHSRRFILAIALGALALVMLIPAARPPSAGAAVAGLANVHSRQSWVAASGDLPNAEYVFEGRDAPLGATAWSDTASVAPATALASYTETHIGGRFAAVTFFGSAEGQNAVAAYNLVFFLVAPASFSLSGTFLASGSLSDTASDYAFAQLFKGLNQPWPLVTETGVSSTGAGPNSASGVLDPGYYILSIHAEARWAGPASASVTFELLDSSALPSVSIGDAMTIEAAPGAGGTLTFAVSLSAPAPSAVTVNYGTSDGTAQAGSDYNANSGTVSFSSGEQAKNVTVPVIGDAATEPDETVIVTLSAANGATIADGTGVGTILNDDFVDFDWTVPDRFGLDANLDSLIDYFTTAASISPPTWRVDFVYTSGGACDPSLSPSLTIDGVPVATGNPAIVASDAALCTIGYAFPAEKKYAVKFELRSSAGSAVGQVTKDVTVQDWLIISLGDSVASGEGNPDIPRTTLWGSPAWQNRQGHRTAFAGPAQAALALERADPKTSVTFVHLACSGASIYEGILTRYRGQEPGAWIPPQVEVMDTLVGSREIDAVTVSTGANDVRFARVVTGCFTQQDCHLATTNNSMLQFFNGWLALLPSAYDALALTLRQSRYDVAADRLYITEYFDALRDQNGAFCDETILEERFQIPGLGISAAESQWASTDMMVRLNQQVSAHAGRAGWKYIGGINTPFRPHGYCSTDRWIVQLSESLANQGNPDGTIHPNRLGHAFYGSRISAALTSDFYQGADLTKPRPPR